MDYAEARAAFFQPRAVDAPPPRVGHWADTPARRLRDAIEPIATICFWSEPAYKAYEHRGLDFLQGYVWGRTCVLGEPDGGGRRRGLRRLRAGPDRHPVRRGQGRVHAGRHPLGEGVRRGDRVARGAGRSGRGRHCGRRGGGRFAPWNRRDPHHDRPRVLGRPAGPGLAGRELGQAVARLLRAAGVPRRRACRRVRGVRAGRVGGEPAHRDAGGLGPDVLRGKPRLVAGGDGRGDRTVAGPRADRRDRPERERPHHAGSDREHHGLPDAAGGRPRSATTCPACWTP